MKTVGMGAKPKATPDKAEIKTLKARIKELEEENSVLKAENEGRKE